MPFIQPARRMAGGVELTAHDDELPTLFNEGVRAVVSLLNIPSDGGVYEAAGFSFLCLPVADGEAPTRSQVEAFATFANAQKGLKNVVVVHCEAGLGRTGTMLAAYLIWEGETWENAIARVRAAEPRAIETSQQIHFFKTLSAERQISH